MKTFATSVVLWMILALPAGIIAASHIEPTAPQSGTGQDS
jgi:hypothetical protein